MSKNKFSINVDEQNNKLDVINNGAVLFTIHWEGSSLNEQRKS